MIPSPVTWFTVPPKRCTTAAQRLTSSVMISRSRSAPTAAAMSIEWTTSANCTVTCLYSANPLSRVTGAPHSLQNLEFGGSSVPHDPQSSPVAVSPPPPSPLGSTSVSFHRWSAMSVISPCHLRYEVLRPSHVVYFETEQKQVRARQPEPSIWAQHPECVGGVSTVGRPGESLGHGPQLRGHFAPLRQVEAPQSSKSFSETIPCQPRAFPAPFRGSPVTPVLAGRGQSERPDRPDAVGLPRIVGVAGVQVDGEAEQPVALRALDLTRHEPPATPPDVQLAFRMGDQVVIPAGVPRTAVVRRRQDHVVTVGEIHKGSRALLAAVSTGRRQHDHGEHANCEVHAPASSPHDRRVDRCGDHAVDRRAGPGGDESLHRSLPHRTASARV